MTMNIFRCTLLIALALLHYATWQRPVAGQVIPSVAPSTVSGLPAGQRAWDIFVNLAPNDDVPRLVIQAQVQQGRFLDPIPEQILFPLGGDPLDTWFTLPGAPPNPAPPNADPVQPLFTVLPVINNNFIELGLLRFGLRQAPGQYIIGRILTETGTVFDLNVQISAEQNPTPISFMFTVPEPTLAPLSALAVLALFRRRYL